MLSISLNSTLFFLHLFKKLPYNDVVQVVIQQVWESFLHDFLLRHSLEAIHFPLHLLKGFVDLLLLPVSLSLGTLLGLRTRFGFRCIWVFRWFWCLWDFWWFGRFGFLGLSRSASFFGSGYEKSLGYVILTTRTI